METADPAARVPRAAWNAEAEERLENWQKNGVPSMVIVLGLLMGLVSVSVPQYFFDFSPVYASLVAAIIGVLCSSRHSVAAFFMYLPCFAMLGLLDFWLLTESVGQPMLLNLLLFQILVVPVFVVRASVFALPLARTMSAVFTVNSVLTLASPAGLQIVGLLGAAHAVRAQVGEPRWLLSLPAAGAVAYAAAYLKRDRCCKGLIPWRRGSLSVESLTPPVALGRSGVASGTSTSASASASEDGAGPHFAPVLPGLVAPAAENAADAA